MENREIRWGGEFGSGRLVTPEVWEIITVLASLPKEQRAGVERLYAMAVAWLNGCPRPEQNIAVNEGGALANAHGDGRNSFLYGLIAHIAEKENEARFYKDWVNGEERVGEVVECESENVPRSYQSGVRRGFVCEAPYQVTSRFWEKVDQAQDKPLCFFEQLGLVERAIQTA